MPYPSRGAWLFTNLTKAVTFWPRLDDLSITMEHPEGLANLDCKVVDQDASQDFDVEDHVVVTYRGTRIFAGHIKVVTEDQADEFGPRIWTLSAQDYTAKLDDAIIRRRTPRKRERVKRRVRWILTYMRSNIWSLDGKDLDGMPSGNPFVEEYDYHGNTVREALDQVAEETRLNFYIDFDNVAHVFRNEVFDSPFDLDNDSPDYSTSFPFRLWSHTLDSTDLGNAVLVEPEQREDSRWSRDATSVNTYGRQERYVGDSELGGPIAAVNVGERTIAGIKDPQVEATLECWEPGLLPGQQVDVTEALWAHSAERFWVRRVEVRGVDPHDLSGEAMLVSTVTIADRLNPTLRRSGKGNSNKNPGTATDTGGHDLATFPDEVTPPSQSVGSSAGSFNIAGQVRASRIHVGGADTYTDTPFLWANGAADALESSYGFYHPHTSKPTFVTCTGLDYSAAGFKHREQWFKLTVPAHPADAAGLRFTVTAGAGKGYAAVAGLKVVVRDAQPDAVGQGTVVGSVAASSSTVITVPIGSVPAEGGVLWVGLQPAWTTVPKEDTFAFYCGVPTSAVSYSYDLDSTGTGYRGLSGTQAWSSLSSVDWLTWDASAPTLGNIDTGDDDTPWQGDNDINDAGQEGDGSAWAFGGGFSVSADSPSGKGIYVDGSREDDEQANGPWSDVGWGHEVHFTIDQHGVTSDPGTRHIQSTTTGEGEQAIGTVHTGDGDYAEGISVSSPGVTTFLAKALTLDEEWVAKFDTRAGVLRGKLWRAADGEPAEWDVQVDMDETEDELDRWSLWIRSGNDGGTAMTTTVSKVVGFDGGVPGQHIVYEVLGQTSGAVRSFKPAHRFRINEITPYVNGIAAAPQAQDGETFTLDFWPTPDSFIAAEYIVE